MMRGLLLGVLIGMSAPVRAQSEEDAVKKLWRDFVDARNNHNAQVMEGMFDTEYDSVNLRLNRVLIRSGKERVETYAKQFAEGQLKNTMLSDIHGVRFITPDVAIMDLEYWIAETPALKTFLTSVQVKRNGKWLITAIRQSRVDEESRQ